MLGKPVRLAAGMGLALILAGGLTPVTADEADPTNDGFAAAVEELRYAHGMWDVTTRFLGPNGEVNREETGTYTFEWVVPDRVLSGRSYSKATDRSSAILFYVRERESVIEMASVGADGHLWVMTGPAGGDTRTTPLTAMADGTDMQLRFTRFNVHPDRFESRMEYSRDRGKTWVQGNQQTFSRAG